MFVGDGRADHDRLYHSISSATWQAASSIDEEDHDVDIDWKTSILSPWDGRGSIDFAVDSPTAFTGRRS